MTLSYLVYLLFEITIWIIIVDCLLSWIPNIDRYKQPFLFIRNFSNLFLDVARKFIPSIGGLDLSPIIIIIFLQVCGRAICMMLQQLGL